jgi:hypothetical protein
MGQIQYTQLSDKKCCYGSSDKVYNIPVGATLHEIATITGVSISRAIELQDLLLQNSKDCTVFNNVEISESIAKNNCSQGLGSVVIVTVVEGQFSSQFSQEDADQKALDYFEANKQQIANTQGGCIEQECLDCTSFRVSKSVDCGEFRYNTNCVDGVCTDVSSEYFVCTGNCNGSTCIADCVDCSFTCPSGSCPDGFNCINGQCVKDCTGAPCSYECPDNDTGNDCTNCINGTETEINCPTGTICENGNCCGSENNFNEFYSCCSGLFLYEGLCVSTCPDGFEKIGETCVAPSICGVTYNIPSGGVTNNQILRNTFQVNDSITTSLRVFLNNLGTSNNAFEVYVNGVSELKTSCLIDDSFYHVLVNENDIIDIDTTVNCNNGSPSTETVSRYGTIGLSCDSFNFDPNLPNSLTYSAFDETTELSTKYWYIKEDVTLEFNFQAFTAGNSVTIRNLGKKEIQYIVNNNDELLRTNNMVFEKGDILYINIANIRSSGDDSVDQQGVPFNGWTMNIIKL